LIIDVLSRASGTEIESLSHRERQLGHRIVFVASRASATETTEIESLSHRDRILQAPFRLASRASATETRASATKSNTRALSLSKCRKTLEV